MSNEVFMAREISYNEALLAEKDGVITALRAENERLRAALERFACTCDRAGNAECSSGEVDCPFWQARAALEGK